MYEGVDVTNWIGAVSVQPLAADQGFMPHMKAKEVLFHFLYGSLICSKRLQSDRPKCWGMLADPSTPQNHAWIIAICRKISKNFNQQRTLNLLFQMKYDSLPNSEKQSSDSQRSWDNPYSLLTLVLFFPPASKTCLNNLVCHSVTFWSWQGYHSSFERGDLEHLGAQKFWYFLIDGYKSS